MITLQIIILCWFTAHADLAPSINNHGSHVQDKGRQELFTQWVPVRLNTATHIVNVESLSRSKGRLEKLMQEKCIEDKYVESIHPVGHYSESKRSLGKHWRKRVYTSTLLLPWAPSAVTAGRQHMGLDGFGIIILTFLCLVTHLFKSLVNQHNLTRLK